MDSEIADIRANLLQTPPAGDALARMTDNASSLPRTLLHSGSAIATAVRDTFTPHVTPEYLGGLGASGKPSSGLAAPQGRSSGSEASEQAPSPTHEAAGRADAETNGSIMTY